MGLTYRQKFNKKYGQPLNQSNSLKKISELSKIPLKNIQAIFRKGKGAFYSNPQSVRPFVKSATQWGYSRVYASISKGSKSSKIDKDLLPY